MTVQARKREGGWSRIKKNCFTYSISNGWNPFSSVGIPYVLEHLMSAGRTVLLQRNVLDGPAWKTHFGLPVACLAAVPVLDFRKLEKRTDESFVISELAVR